jgi:single-stranded DNA-binding protein
VSPVTAQAGAAMSLHILASRALVGDPQHREGVKGAFTTATIHTGGDEFVSIIAFGLDGERLAEHSKGSPLSVVGRATLSSWIGRDGIEKHGLNVVVEQLASLKPKAQRRARAYPESRTRPTYRDEGSTLKSDEVDDLFLDEDVR